MMHPVPLTAGSGHAVDASRTASDDKQLLQHVSFLMKGKEMISNDSRSSLCNKPDPELKTAATAISRSNFSLFAAAAAAAAAAELRSLLPFPGSVDVDLVFEELDPLLLRSLPAADDPVDEAAPAPVRKLLLHPPPDVDVLKTVAAAATAASRSFMQWSPTTR